MDFSIRQELYAYQATTLKDRGCAPLLLGGTSDHVHMLCMLSTTENIAQIIGDVKRYSSKWIKTKGDILATFAWQRGYGVFSVSQSDVQRVRKYILQQEEHHKKMIFQEEFRKFLKRYEIEFDERYVWD